MLNQTVQLLKSWEYKNGWGVFVTAYALYSYLNLESTKTLCGIIITIVALYSYLNLESTKTMHSPFEV